MLNDFHNTMQKSIFFMKRGLLEIPNPPEPRYQIVQYPEGFIKVEDTKLVFGDPRSLEKVQVCKCCLSMLRFLFLLLSFSRSSTLNSALSKC